MRTGCELDYFKLKDTLRVYVKKRTPRKLIQVIVNRKTIIYIIGAPRTFFFQTERVLSPIFFCVLGSFYFQQKKKVGEGRERNEKYIRVRNSYERQKILSFNFRGKCEKAGAEFFYL